MERLASCHVVLCALRVFVTETQENVPKVAGLDTMDCTAISYVVIIARITYVGKMMGHAMLVNLAPMEKCVTRNVQHIVLESCVTNLRRQQSAPLAVILVTMEQAVSSSVHTIVWTTSVSALRANVQVVCQGNRGTCVIRVSV